MQVICNNAHLKYIIFYLIQIDFQVCSFKHNTFDHQPRPDIINQHLAIHVPEDTISAFHIYLVTTTTPVLLVPA